MEPITLRIKRLSPTAALPVRMTEHAAGFDLSADVPAAVVLRPGDIATIPCGFAMATPPGYEGQIRPRSGLSSRHGIAMPSGIGTVDADYRGEVKVPLINLGRVPFAIEPGMRVAQLLVLPVPPVTLVEVDALDETARGGGGFGHTGFVSGPSSVVR